MIHKFLFSMIALVTTTVHAEDSQTAANQKSADRIQPSAANSRYWQYKGAPVLLLGGSKDDSLFQIPDLKQQLDLIHKVGGNYIRNTMSDRADHEFEVYAFGKDPSGAYDLNTWNDEYWQRFENLLRWTEAREIIVQIEVWDRFDFSDIRRMNNWRKHPFNPKNNVNYTAEATGLAESYAKHHPSADQQPFFHTAPEMPNYQKKYDTIRHFQERFVAKLLSYSLSHGNVLYCMDNETSTDPRWGQYWLRFIRAKAADAGVEVYATDMFDDVFRAKQSKSLRMQFDQPKRYPFIDISQVNSRNFNEDHWNQVRWITRQLDAAPRPLNHTKIYSAGQTSFGSGTPVDGVERFWRNLIAGSASCRFHRPTSGIGINEIAQACIASARKAESIVKFWDVAPRMDLLGQREPDEAYLAADPGKSYLLYFTDGGSVELDLQNATQPLRLRWIDVSTGQWGDEATIEGGRQQTVAAPGKGGWVAALAVAN